MDKNKLLLREIKTPNFGKIYCPLVSELLDLDDEEYNKLLLPFVIKMDDIELNQEFITEIEIKLGRKFTVFDYLMCDKNMIESIVNALKFFYKTNNIYPYQDISEICFLVDYRIESNMYYANDGGYILSYKNWDDLCELIKKIMCLYQEKKEERKVTIQDESNRALLEEYLRLQKQKEEEDRKLAEKNALSLYDIVLIVVSDYKDWDMVLNMTYYRLITSYRIIMGKDNWETSMRYHTSYKFDTSNMKFEHWTDAIRKSG